MTDFKIRPPTGPTQRPVQGTENADGATRPFDVSNRDAAATVTETPDLSEPSALVEEIRAGRLDLDQAVQLLIDRALETPVVATASETLREEIRQKLTELIQDDPTLADLASAMKR